MEDDRAYEPWARRTANGKFRVVQAESADNARHKIETEYGEQVTSISKVK